MCTYARPEHCVWKLSRLIGRGRATSLINTEHSLVRLSIWSFAIFLGHILRLYATPWVYDRLLKLELRLKMPRMHGVSVGLAIRVHSSRFITMAPHVPPHALSLQFIIPCKICPLNEPRKRLIKCLYHVILTAGELGFA